MHYRAVNIKAIAGDFIGYRQGKTVCRFSGILVLWSWHLAVAAGKILLVGSAEMLDGWDGRAVAIRVRIERE